MERRDLDAIAARLSAEAPGVVIHRPDFGWSLHCRHPVRDEAMIVYQAPRDDIDQPELRADLAAVERWLSS
ncbi:hypothetical protein [Chelatococcus sp. XZ-Ab1]|uniref:hypothetical protein n=1 Tax=Chelatococcus sp. XZ-Ab1 TaxID=3034027 RepID=UPI0023E455FB|nr:hypothetical protein [Chelatococcus sp. XZ-Ab1]